ERRRNVLDVLIKAPTFNSDKRIALGTDNVSHSSLLIDSHSATSRACDRFDRLPSCRSRGCSLPAVEQRSRLKGGLSKQGLLKSKESIRVLRWASSPSPNYTARQAAP